ncbi:uncharacterized protein LY89DRAFT_734110 [Mollisia scopiformis]|uniref:Apple domain-containing protein n=1 Tax=Mollisia scopiformis TaxID=149040 RepID=A0A194XBI7_MOLSC|nr:uncharacterized protein LY89DRAFT_734110 [Mollisia scopiformis]KUJ17122.1 hypothetical protein LY89DRAFT_734110 [Mollisia scopiformis]
MKAFLALSIYVLGSSLLPAVTAAPTSRVVRAPTSPARSGLVQRQQPYIEGQQLSQECQTGSGNALGNCTFYDDYNDAETTQCQTACSVNNGLCYYIIANGVTTCY